jgi:hypothetical protein
MKAATTSGKTEGRPRRREDSKTKSYGGYRARRLNTVNPRSKATRNLVRGSSIGA